MVRIFEGIKNLSIVDQFTKFTNVFSSFSAIP